MKIKKIKFNEFVSTWNLINILIGYPFITMLFSPLLGNVAETTVLTVPYRAFSLLLALIVLLLNFKAKIKKPLALTLFIFFWILVLIRMFYDLEIQSEYFIIKAHKQRLWLFSLGLIIVPMVSIIKSINRIDLAYSKKWIYRLGVVFLLISFFSVVQDASATERIGANKALDSTSFGKTAILISIIAFYNMISSVKQRKSFLFHSVIFLFGLYVGLRSGSRGPILAFLIVFFFWLSFKNNLNIRKGVFKFFILISITVASQQILLNLINRISPVTSVRIQSTIKGSDVSTINRFDSYHWFVQEINKSPILGSHFARLQDGRFPGYAHNIFLDILLGFGIIGLSIFLYIISKAISNTHLSLNSGGNYWIGLLFLMFFVLSITSGAYYTNPDLNITIVLTLLYFRSEPDEN